MFKKARAVIFLMLVALLAVTVTQAQDDVESVVVADFEAEELFLGSDSNGLDIGYVAWGDTGGNVTLDLVAAEGDLALPEQDGDNTVLGVSYEINGFGGFTDVFTDGEEWVTQDWTEYNTLDFWFYGSEAGGEVQVEIFDNRAPDSTADTAERFYFRFRDNFAGWQFFSIPFEMFNRRSDWQPSGAPSDGFGLDEVHGYAFSFPPGYDPLTNYIDNVAISTGEGNIEEASAVVEDEEAEEADTTTALADFEVDELFLGTDSDGLQIGYVSWGDAPDNVSLELVAAEDDLALPEQDGDNNVLAVTYDIGAFGGFTHAFTDGEEWVTQDWTEFTTLDFWFYGAESGAMIQVEIFDNRAPDAASDSAERYYYRIEDNFAGWQFFSIPFDFFQRRTDWQPEGAPSDGLGLDEVHGYSFGFPAGVGEFTNYIDNVSLSDGSGNVTREGGVIEPVAMPEYNADGDWELVWSDEFEAEAGEPININYWTCEVGGWGWGNNQLEHNTDRTENVFHNGEGFLVITALEEEFRGNDYTSGRCNTMDKVEFTYGRVEARINLPEGQGIWPAFWMLGADFPEIGWPETGEIDIMEYIGAEPRSIHGTVHGPEYYGSGGLGARYINDEPVAEDFHVFGIEWEPEIIRWTFNGEVYHELDPERLYGGTWVFDDDFFMLINVAVGGNWPGYPDDTTVFPQEMLVDWVRIYQRQ